jgi:hypothetical protein
MVMNKIQKECGICDKLFVPKTVKLYRLEPKDCYTIGEIAGKFGISDSFVYKYIRKFSIPTRQIGKYVYAPKSEIDHIYNSK